MPLAVASFTLAATLQPDADPDLELGAVYRRLANETKARECWLAAQARPGGHIRAQVNLLGSYERAGETALYSKTLDSVLKQLLVERETRLAHWRQALTEQGLTATADEMDALLLLDTELTDPAPLQARLAALQGGEKKE